MKTSIFLAAKKDQTPLGKILGFLDSQVSRSATGTYIDPDIASKAISLESMDQMVHDTFVSSMQNFSVSLESEINAIASEHQCDFNSAQKQSATIAAIMASNPRVAQLGKFAQFDSKTPFIPATESIERFALEGYDDRNNKTTARYSVTYNLYAPRQDVFGETLFPTVTIAPDQPGFSISIDLVHIIDQVRRNTKGTTDEYNRKNILHAQRDPSILRNDATAVIPVFRPENKHIFVDEAVMLPATISKNGEDITTSALRFGARTFSLLGNSQTDLELSVAEFNQTDVLDTAIRLKTLYLQVGDVNSNEIITFDTTSLAGSTFNEAPQGDDRKMILNLTASDLIINANTRLYNSAAMALLDPIVTGNFMVRLKVEVSMNVLLDIGDFNAMTSPVELVEIIDSTGTVHSPTSAQVAAIADLFKDMRMIGYDVEARRINSNRRTIAQLLDSRIYTQNYAIPTYAPFTVQRPQNAGDQNDTAAVNALVQVARALTQAHAVYKVLETDRILSGYVDKRRSIHTVTELMGVSRMTITPFYEKHEVAVVDNMASIKSHEIAADARAVLVNLIRDIAFRAHRDSGLQIALDATYSGAAPKPVVIIATDPYIEQYLHVTGDLRTLADKFDVRIVSTPQLDMMGKIFLTFGNFDPALDGQPNPYHFGNMAWRPETVMAFPTARDGQTSFELTVMPTFLHIVNLPVLARIDVSGLSEAMTKKPIIGFEDMSKNTGTGGTGGTGGTP